MRRLMTGLALSCAAVLAAPMARAEIDGHGPDAWRVTGVARDDVLNMRMGPGTEYLVIDSLPPDARGLEQITCVPLLIPSIYHRLTDAQRENLPPRWCLMRSSDFSKAGWVAQRFLMEDGLEEIHPDADGAAVETGPGDTMINDAARLVGDLYAAFETQRSAVENPFGPTLAPDYFFAGMVPELAGHGADLLYGAQDFQGEITRIAPDPDQPMLQGMITVNVDFTNFGQPNRAIFRLRADSAQPGAPLRIFDIEINGQSLP
ncbi:SH3 domain-containing protein [Paracoccus seriniphilus]|uniref:SH3 domain-containing protein n=1 Tax=Paracoccus seriniphilus TaxID=184748 RepID=UPI00356A5A67